MHREMLRSPGNAVPARATPAAPATPVAHDPLAQAAQVFGLSAAAVRDGALHAALNSAAATQRPPAFLGLLRATAAVAPNGATPDALAQILRGLIVAHARVDNQAWPAYLKTARAITHSALPAPWEVFCENLARAEPDTWPLLVTAAQRLGTRGWDCASVLSVCLPAMSSYTREHWREFLSAAEILCQPTHSAEARLDTLRSVTMVEWQAWRTLAAAAETLCDGMTPDRSRLPIVRALAQAYASNRPSDRPTLLEPAARLCTRRMNAEERASIVRSLTIVSASERAELQALCVPLRQTGVESAQFVAYVNTLADTPRQARESHRDRLLEQARILVAGVGHRGVDVENVAVHQRVSKAAASIEALRATATNRGRDVELASIARFVELAALDAETPLSLRRLRAGQSEMDNALRTLHGAATGRDYSPPLINNPAYHYGENVIGLGDLAALVWGCIRAYNAPSGKVEDSQRERANLRVSFVLALAECIEDDGHRVCPVGVSQRLLQVLQGYHSAVHLDTLTPQQLVCVLTQDFDDEKESVPDFIKRAEARALQLYEKGGDDHTAFMEDLLAYLEMTYDFHPA